MKMTQTTAGNYTTCHSLQRLHYCLLLLIHGRHLMRIPSRNNAFNKISKNLPNKNTVHPLVQTLLTPALLVTNSKLSLMHIFVIHALTMEQTASLVLHNKWNKCIITICVICLRLLVSIVWKAIVVQQETNFLFTGILYPLDYYLNSLKYILVSGCHCDTYSY